MWWAPVRESPGRPQASVEPLPPNVITRGIQKTFFNQCLTDGRLAFVSETRSRCDARVRVRERVGCGAADLLILNAGDLPLQILVGGANQFRIGCERGGGRVA